ncbi:hypothetical protein [Curtobacterium flaccumfaciens]|uniref:hypothetical protein n=1 Tax=Curtobacterium flaccumfaciens TaxID=2035 RepID=UPI003D9A2CF7
MADHEDDLRDEVFAIQVVSGLRTAGFTKASFQLVHVAGYLLAALSSVYRAGVLDADVLKRNGAPFVPALQNGIERLLRRRVVTIEQSFSASVAVDSVKLDLEGETLPRAAQRLLSFSNDRALLELSAEIAMGLSAMDDPIAAFSWDASWSDPARSENVRIDLSDFQNRSAQVAESIPELLSKLGMGDAQQVSLYLAHLERLGESAVNDGR